MPSVKPTVSIKEYQQFVQDVYGLPNDRYFSLQDKLTNCERFITRGLKGIRKGDAERTKLNLIISLSWFMSVVNQFHIDIENETWKRFPYLCSYCATCPCSCKAKKVQTRQPVTIDEAKRPNTLEDFQKMFNEIYPAATRTLDQAGIHLVEEMGEVAEAIFTYHGNHNDEDFKKVVLECADLFSCLLGVFNSLEISLAKELATMFVNNCHACHQTPCVCNFVDITQFKS
jgi:NTP pyrophosphatase (non-canonical NTP hydrolase)